MPNIERDFEPGAAGRRVAKLSGAVLGYVTNNLPGAVLGYKLGGRINSYRNTSKVMAPIPRKRSVSTHSNAVSKRRAAFFNTVANPRRTVLYPRTVLRSSAGIRTGKVVPSKRRSSANVNDATVRKKGNKVAKESRKRDVKVNRKFKAKVQAALKGKDPVGFYQEISMASVMPLNDNAQTVAIRAGIASGSAATTLQALFFNPIKVLSAASTLWNGKTPTNPHVLQSGNMFPAQTTRIMVLDSWVKFTYQNNTARTLTLKLYDLSLKNTQPLINSDGITLSYVGAVTNWQNLMTQANPNGTTDFAYQNPLSNGVTTLYMTPQTVPAMTAMYSIDTTTVILDPGKEYVHILKGPKNKMYDFAKFWTGRDQLDVTPQFLDAHKMTKEHMCVMYGNLVNTTLNSPGRFTDIAAGGPYGLLTEVREFFKLSLPEQAGTIGSGAAAPAGTGIPLGRRTYSYAIQNFIVGGQNGAVTMIEDENPQAPTTVGV